MERTILGIPIRPHRWTSSAISFYYPVYGIRLGAENIAFTGQKESKHGDTIVSKR